MQIEKEEEEEETAKEISYTKISQIHRSNIDQFGSQRRFGLHNETKWNEMKWDETQWNETQQWNKDNKAQSLLKFRIFRCFVLFFKYNEK